MVADFGDCLALARVVHRVNGFKVSFVELEAGYFE